MRLDTPPPFHDQTALVTGGARRVGASIVRHLHSAGANVVIHCHRSSDEADRLAQALCEVRPGSATVLRADLLDLSGLPVLIEQAVGRFGRLDLLVNNASTFYPTPVGDITPQAFDDLIGTNLRAPLFLAQAAAPHLRRHNGQVINIIDIHGIQPLKGHPVYSIAKAGLAMMTRSLSRELAPKIRVNGVAPGPVMWPEADLDDRLKDRILDRTSLKRMGSPDDIARAVVFFATAAPYVTGQILAVDGGRSAGGF